MYEAYTRLVSFCSVKQALLTEEVLIRIGVSAALIPKPRQVDANCGQCVLFREDCQEKVLEVLSAKNIRWSKLFKRNPGTNRYELLAENEEGTAAWTEGG